MNYYPFHIGDYTVATAHLDPLEDIAYRRLIDVYYQIETHLPDDFQWIIKKTRMKGFETQVTDVLAEFFSYQEGSGYLHVRCEEEIERTLEKRIKAKGSADKRWQSKRDADVMRTQCERIPNALPTDSEGSADAMRLSCDSHAPNPNPNPNPNPKKITKPKSAAPPFVVPDWIPEDTWAAYLVVRTAKRAKNEPFALGLIVKDLTAFKAQGHDPVAVLNTSIKCGWTGVFAPKTPFGQVPVSIETRQWHESQKGIEDKAAELGLDPLGPLENFPSFKQRVMRAFNAPAKPLSLGQLTHLSNLRSSAPKGLQ